MQSQSGHQQQQQQGARLFTGAPSWPAGEGSAESIPGVGSPQVIQGRGITIRLPGRPSEASPASGAPLKSPSDKSMSSIACRPPAVFAPLIRLHCTPCSCMSTELHNAQHVIQSAGLHLLVTTDSVDLHCRLLTCRQPSPESAAAAGAEAYAAQPRCCVPAPCAVAASPAAAHLAWCAARTPLPYCFHWPPRMINKKGPSDPTAPLCALSAG